jgi:hypothetical protein
MIQNLAPTNEKHNQEIDTYNQTKVESIEKKIRTY